jgi:hypothetical protein
MNKLFYYILYKQKLKFFCFCVCGNCTYIFRRGGNWQGEMGGGGGQRRIFLYQENHDFARNPQISSNLHKAYDQIFQ